jgi:tRNA(Ile2) C34 agmatinyltransferase TiaS
MDLNLDISNVCARYVVAKNSMPGMDGLVNGGATLSKSKTHKRTRLLEGEVKRLRAEVKRLKKEKGLDKDEIIETEELETQEMKPCTFCLGIMTEDLIAGRVYWRCQECKRTHKR